MLTRRAQARLSRPRVTPVTRTPWPTWSEPTGISGARSPGTAT